MNQGKTYLIVVVATIIIGLGQIVDLFIRTTGYFVNTDSPYYIIIFSMLFDRLALIGFLIAAIIILFRAYRKTLNELDAASTKIERHNNTLAALANAPEHIHRFNHYLRYAVDAIDRGRRVGPNGRRQALAEWDTSVQKALLHATLLFNSIRPGTYSACIKIIGTFDDKTKSRFGLNAQKEQLIEATGASAFRIVTAARDELSRPDRAIVDKLGLEEGFNKLEDNRLYSDLFHSDTVPWFESFNSSLERASHPLYGADKLPKVWEKFPGEKSPESTLYCSICISLDDTDEKSKKPEPSLEATVARRVDVNGVLYIDCLESDAFGPEAKELAHSFADALFKVLDYKIRYVKGLL